MSRFYKHRRKIDKEVNHLSRKVYIAQKVQKWIFFIVGLSKITEPKNKKLRNSISFLFNIHVTSKKSTTYAIFEKNDQWRPKMGKIRSDFLKKLFFVDFSNWTSAHIDYGMAKCLNFHNIKKKMIKIYATYANTWNARKKSTKMRFFHRRVK